MAIPKSVAANFVAIMSKYDFVLIVMVKEKKKILKKM